MKIILSRKAFDSASGKVPNPILPDGRLVPLPIPDKQSPIRYADIRWDGLEVAPIVAALTKGRIPPTHLAHLDPDLNADSLPRAEGWRPVFGQDGPAQGHLRKNKVGVGDLFLFFGLFRPVEVTEHGLRFVPGSAARHVFWGWLQIGAVVPVDRCRPDELAWARYHPHFHRLSSPNNTLYIAADRLHLGGWSHQSGAGHFPQMRSRLQLTASTARRPGDWDLPAWMQPTDGRNPLTYHGDPNRWSPDEDRVRLATVGRGQEFVLDSGNYPQAPDWAASIIGVEHSQTSTG